MKISSFLGRLFHPTILRLASVTLFALAFSRLAFCGEIHDAVIQGDLAKVRTLLKDNPDLVTSVDNNGYTPLYWAALQGRKEVAELLLANKAEVNTKDNNGETPLFRAALQGHKEVVELLVARKAEVKAKDNHFSDRLLGKKQRPNAAR